MKKKRAANFSSEEKDVLLETVIKQKDILFGKVTLFNDWPQKNAAWIKVLEAVNQVSYVERSLHDIRRKLKDLKASTRKKYMDNQGGFRNVEEATAEEQKVLSLLGSEVQTPIKVEMIMDQKKEESVPDQSKEEPKKRPFTRSQSENPSSMTDETPPLPLKRIKLILRQPDDHDQTTCINPSSDFQLLPMRFNNHCPIKVESFNDDVFENSPKLSNIAEEFHLKFLEDIAATTRKMLNQLTTVINRIKGRSRNSQRDNVPIRPSDC